MEIYTNTKQMTVDQLIELAWNRLFDRLNETRFVEFIPMVKELADELNGAVEFVDKKSLDELEDIFDELDGDPRGVVEFIKRFVPSRVNGKRIRFLTAAPEDNRMMVVSMVGSDDEITIVCSDAQYIDSHFPRKKLDDSAFFAFVELYDAVLKTADGVCEDVDLIQRARRENMTRYEGFKVENKTRETTKKAIVVPYTAIKKIAVYPYVEQIANNNEIVSKWYNPLHRG